MTHFNRGKFNVKSGAAIMLTGTSSIEVEAQASAHTVMMWRFADPVALDITIDTAGDQVVNKYSGRVSSPIVFGSQLVPRVNKWATSADTEINYDTSIVYSTITKPDPVTLDVVFDASAVSSMLGQEYIELSGITLRPGEQLEIDTCALTATINGQNVMHLLSNDGDFFDFFPGANEIEIEATGAGAVAVDTFWKDKWL
ncbi:phage distal tail protein [Peptoniphilus sp. HCN-40583]|uniref:phage distal tail protein n=1 Tax=Peptoniphilus sp. HCN-40583 TaxID=3134662 RepID=UPI0030BAE70C